MRARVHQEHDQEHDVTGEATRLRVHDGPRRFLAHLRTLNVEHVDIVCRHVDNGPEERAVGDLTMKPHMLVEGDLGCREQGSEKADDVSKDCRAA